MSKGIGDEFQIQTKHTRNNLGGYLDWASKPSNYKVYPTAKNIKLDKEITNKTITIVDVLTKRKSIRTYSNRPVTNKELSIHL